MATNSPNPQESTYDNLANKELEIIKSLENNLDELPDVPIVKDWFLWKIKELKAQTTLAQGIDPLTGEKMQSTKERLAAFGKIQAEALKHGVRSASDAVLAAEGGQGENFITTLRSLNKKGSETKIVENLPKFFNFASGKTQNETIKKALTDTSNLLDEMLKVPDAKEAMVGSLRNWDFWKNLTEKDIDSIEQERVLRIAEEGFDKVENLTPPPDNVMISLKPTLDKTAKKTKRAIEKALSRTQTQIKRLSSAGQVRLSEEDKVNLRGLVPIGEFKDLEIAAGLKLYAQGAKSVNLEKTVDELSTLGRKDSSSLYRIAFIVAAMEETYGNEARYIHTANAQPQAVIQPSFGSAPSQQDNQLLLQRDSSGYLKPVLNIGVDIAKDKAKDLVVNALKKGGKKLVEKGLKTGAGIAVKAGLTKAAGAIAGTIAGGPAGIILTAAGFVKDIAKKLSSWVQRGLRKLFGLGTRDPQKRRALAFAGLAGMFLVAGFLPGAIVAGGIAVGYAAASAGAISGVVTAGQALIYAVTTVIIPSIAIPTAIAIFAIPIIIAILLFIINTSAYLVPPFEFAGIGVVESPYINIEKIPVSVDSSKCQKDSPDSPLLSCENDELTVTVEYTITVTAARGTLTNIQFDNSCDVIRDGIEPACTSVAPTAPALITTSEPFTFTYTSSYNTQFTDSLNIDTFTVTADVESEGVIGTTAASSASVKIGDPPDNCPSGWPVQREGGESPIPIKQGPHTSGGTHDLVEAIDISTTTGHTVRATHTGVVSTGNYGNYGDYVDVSSTCETTNGPVTVTTRYSHLNTISVVTGATVTLGQTLGTTGSSGTSAPHLHYEFRPVPGPIQLVIPYVPVNIPRACNDFDSDPNNNCNVFIN